MAEVLLFHHAQGQTEGFAAFADELRRAGHTVHAPDLFDGRTFGSIDEGMAYVEELGFGEIIDRGERAANELPNELVYAGFSLGVVPAQKLAQTRAGARGALLFYSCVPTSEFGTSWPGQVPVQIHAMDADPIFVGEGDIDAARAIVESTEQAELFLYPGEQHYFADSSLPSYDPGATALLTRRVLAFLEDMAEAPSRQELEAAHCWEADDRVPGRPAMTEYRRRLRYHQARWRETKGYPIGSQPLVPRDGKPSRPVGSRLPLDYARETGATFLTAGALDSARARASVTEPHQSFDHQRLWADLLWSPTMAFNLFGDLAGDLELADRAVHAWWPDAPGTVSDVRFAHSPGRFDPEYLNSLRAFDAAFVLDLGDGTNGIVALDVSYHEWAKPETPKPRNLWRNLEVAERSGAFAPGATDAVKGRSELCVMWLEHLLLLSMLQHVSGTWTWGRYVVVHPAANSDYAGACARYRDLLVDRSTFSSVTVEELLDAGALPRPMVAAVRDRYIPG